MTGDDYIIDAFRRERPDFMLLSDITAELVVIDGIRVALVVIKDK